MSSRPRRSAAQRASEAITDLADRDAGMSSSRSRRSGDGKALASTSRDAESPSAESQHMHLTVKVPASRLRQATTSSRGASSSNQISINIRDQFTGGQIVHGKRSTRGVKKRYIESDSDEEDEEEEEEEEDDDDEDDDDDDDEDEEDEEDEEQDEIQVGKKRVVDRGEGDDDDEDEEMQELGDEDAEGEVIDDEMDVDAEGEDEELGDEDAEGDIDMDVAPPAAHAPPTIKISKPTKKPSTPSKAKSVTVARGSRTPSKAKSVTVAKGSGKTSTLVDDDDEELSELESDVEDEINDTVEVIGEEDAEGEDDDEAVAVAEEDVDAEGEEIEVADEDVEEEDEDLGSDGETPGGGSRAETPDLSKMTRRQRARFEDKPQEYMKLSDEVQVKKHFTAEELSMRRAEMARRRRNLSEKRNEEVKAETINKLLKRQAPKMTKRNIQQLAGDETPDVEAQRPDPGIIRWISSREGVRLAVPEEIIESPAGRPFIAQSARGLPRGKMVQEVA